MISKTIVDGLKYVLQNVRLQSGDIRANQVNIVPEAIEKISTLESVISLQVQEMNTLRTKIQQLESKLADDAKYHAMRLELNEGKRCCRE
jgi:hypothetical protein